MAEHHTIEKCQNLVRPNWGVGGGGGVQSLGQCPKIRSFLRLPLGKTLGFI